MHVSLDSALGRQRRLNSVGESVLQIAPNAAAAYSLRSLTGGSPKVVRVRRASDNGERDFTSAEINSGEMVSWVNQQTIAPLDIQALEADGRTGDFLIAKAAYSLRSLGTRQATLAATGDTVARANGKFVAQVRRNVNGDLKSFTATEVTDGTLLSFVNESFTSSLPLDVAGSAAAAYGLRNLSSSYDGNVVEVRRSSDDTTRDFTAAEITDGTLLAFVGTGGSDNGFVKTWYDQSGNSNNAAQATAASQPKIVDGGALVTGGLDFDGSNHYFDVSGIDEAQPITGFIQLNPDSTAEIDTEVLDGVAGNTNRILFDSTGGKWRIFAGNNQPSSVSVVTAPSLLYFLVNSTSSELGLNGDTASVVNAGTNSGWADGLTIGKSISTNFYDGKMSEIIFYPSDQSDKRRAIEESIATANGITLGSFNRDGFVKTWYDQSVTNEAGDTATGNHATQATAASQPKIVSAGAYLGEVDFGGTDDVLNFTSIDFSTNPWFAASVFKYDNTASTIIGGGSTQWITNVGSSTNYSARNTQDSAIHNFTASPAFVNGSTNLVTVFRTGDTLSGSANGNLDATADPVIESNDTFQADRLSLRASTYGTFSIKEVIIYNSDQSANRTALEANIGETYSISGIPAYDNEVDGFVETWYDQSGNGRDATQATASVQPKIVDEGSLVTGGIEYDLTKNLVGSTLSAVSIFTVMKYADTSNAYSFISTRVASNQGINVSNASSGSIFAARSFGSGGSLNLFTTTTTTNESLLSSFHEDGAFSSFVNGGSEQTSSANIGFVSESSQALNIGFKTGASGGTNFLGTVKEITLYRPSNESANRVALETNINSQYSIF